MSSPGRLRGGRASLGHRGLTTAPCAQPVWPARPRAVGAASMPSPTAPPLGPGSSLVPTAQLLHQPPQLAGEVSAEVAWPEPAPQRLLAKARNLDRSLARVKASRGARPVPSPCRQDRAPPGASGSGASRAPNCAHTVATSSLCAEGSGRLRVPSSGVSSLWTQGERAQSAARPGTRPTKGGWRRPPAVPHARAHPPPRAATWLQMWNSREEKPRRGAAPRTKPHTAGCCRRWT